MDRTGQVSWTGQNRIGQDRTGTMDKTGQDRIGQVIYHGPGAVTNSGKTNSGKTNSGKTNS